MSSENVEPGGSPGDDAEEVVRPVVTRREFMAGAGAGLAVGAVVAGGIAVATRPAPQTQAVVTAPGAPAAVIAQPPAQAAQQAAPAQQQAQAPTPASALPLSQR